jgi:hypothetical protein
VLGYASTCVQRHSALQLWSAPDLRCACAVVCRSASCCNTARHVATHFDMSATQSEWRGMLARSRARSAQGAHRRTVRRGIAACCNAGFPRSGARRCVAGGVATRRRCAAALCNAERRRATRCNAPRCGAASAASGATRRSAVPLWWRKLGRDVQDPKLSCLLTVLAASLPPASRRSDANLPTHVSAYLAACPPSCTCGCV